MRRLTVLPLLVSLSLLLTLPGIASAARAQHFHDEETFLFCDSLALSDGSTAFMILDVSEQFGTFTELAIWAEGSDPFEDPPAAIGGDSSVTVAADLSSIAASIDLFEFDPTVDPPIGEFLSVATVDATLTSSGDPIPFDDEFKEGNHNSRQSGTRQSFLVEGMLELADGPTADLSGCQAEHISYDVFSNNPAGVPASFVFRNSGLTMSCAWETDIGSVFLFADAMEFGTFSDIFIVQDESFASGFSEDAVFTTSEFSATYEIVAEEGLPPVGTASASAAITPTNERIHLTNSFEDGTSKLLGQVLAVDGTLELDLDGGLTLDMDASSCQALDFKSTDHFVDPRGPKPQPIANDTPETALPLAIGESVTINNAGAAPEPEAPCLVEVPDIGDVEVPISFTAWWTFAGTGGDVTVSTAGSDFDTVVAVYQLVDGALAQVACVDDLEDSLQAVVTVSTVADATYYIQAGGFGGDTGNLVVSLE